MEISLKHQKDSLDQKISDLEKQIKKLKEQQTFEINSIKSGDTFNLGGLHWVILDNSGEGYLCLGEPLSKTMRFNNDYSRNKWIGCSLRHDFQSVLNQNGLSYNLSELKRAKEELGKNSRELFLSLRRQIIALNGSKEYGKCEDRISLLTLEEYQKYRHLIPFHWETLLLTPRSIQNPFITDATNEILYLKEGEINFVDSLTYKKVCPLILFSKEIF